MGKRKQILYPIFLELSSFVTEKFWKCILEDLAYGICPYGTFFDNNTLCCRFPSKEFNFQFSSGSPKNLSKQLITLLSDKLNLLSDHDKFVKRELFYKILAKKQGEGWLNIKKKSIKELLIENYVIEMKNKYMLSNQQMKRLLSVIMIGFQFKAIKNSDVCYDSEKSKITNIKGITITRNKIKLSYKLGIFNGVDNTCNSCSKSSMKNNWLKYLSQL